MTADWRSWLPGDIAGRADVQAEIGKVIAAWTDAWFASAPFGAPEYRAAGGEAAYGDTVALVADGADTIRLACLAIDLQDSPDAMAGADRMLARALGEQMLSDLKLRLEKRLGPAPAPSCGAGGLEVHLTPRSGRTLVRCRIGLEPLVRLARAAVQSTDARQPALDARAAGLGDTSVAIEAMLGQVQLSLGDLRGLAKGDVLVLDTPLDGTVRLALSGAAAPFATARVTQSEDALTLVVGS